MMKIMQKIYAWIGCVIFITYTIAIIVPALLEGRLLWEHYIPFALTCMYVYRVYTDVKEYIQSLNKAER